MLPTGKSPGYYASAQQQPNSNPRAPGADHSEHKRTGQLKTISDLANSGENTNGLRYAVESYIGHNECSGFSTFLTSVENERDLLDLALEFYLDGKNNAAYELGKCITQADSSGRIGVDREQDFYIPRLFTLGKSILVYHISKAADGGSKVAQFALGKWHAEGTNGVKQDLEKAVEYLQLSAAQGYERAAKFLDQLPKSDFMLAKECEFADAKQAISLYKQAAASGDNRAMFRLGELYLKVKDHDNAIKYFTQAKQSGHVDASFHLAEIYATQYKQCIVKSWNSDLRDKALQNYKEAIEGKGQFAGLQGKAAISCLEFKADHCEDRNAKYELGKFFLARNAGKAEKYLKPLADAGHADAAYLLAKEYGDTNSSLLTYDSPTLSSRYHELAVKNGHPLAVLEKAARGGDSSAMFQLYEMYSKGNESISLKADQAKAQAYLFKAAEKGDSAAINVVLELKKTGSVDASIGSIPNDEYFANLAFKQLKAEATKVTKQATQEYKVTVEAETKLKEEAKLNAEQKARVDKENLSKGIFATRETAKIFKPHEDL